MEKHPMVDKYLAIFNLSFTHALKNYKALIGLSIFLMTCLIIFAHLWKIAAAKTGITSFNPQQLLWYIAFNEWVLVSIPDTQEEMEQDLRSGRLAYLLPRPVSYLGATFAEAAGTLSVNLLVLGLVTFSFTWLQAGALPFGPSGLLVTAVFGLMAGLIGIIFQMVIGLSAFWLTEVGPFYWIWEKLLFMLGGLMLPLTVYPQWMQTIAHFTPFPAILGERSALALDFNLHHILTLTCSLLGWGVFGSITLFILYRKGLRILNMGGG
jgi:ABC-2 type transport system permease protein